MDKENLQLLITDLILRKKTENLSIAEIESALQEKMRNKRKREAIIRSIQKEEYNAFDSGRNRKDNKRKLIIIGAVVIISMPLAIWISGLKIIPQEFIHKYNSIHGGMALLYLIAIIGLVLSAIFMARNKR